MTTSPHSPRRTLARITGLLTVVGALAGVVWALLAPGVRMLVVEQDRGVLLTSESQHHFVATAMFCGIGLVVGVLSAVVVWGVRRVRGPAAVAVLVVGSGLSAGAAILAGAGVASLRFPDVDSPAVGSIIAVAPGIGTPTVLIVQPLFAALTYLLLAGMSPHDDLDTGAVTEPADPAAVPSPLAP
ncbi:DUF2567 domain-containing protein [Prescottella subtropica]|uniref:DUF2567 domain-containing protein n=1 Tax=Prescottella subtropica TaxID=2545757 RepID=UPI001F4F4B7A|nr:DUF2567 domain-containing protein [Prescottella subtropica]